MNEQTQTIVNLLKTQTGMPPDQDVEQRLETIFFSILDALRGVWDTTNAANVLLSLIFYKRLFSLVEDGEIKFVQIKEEHLELIRNIRTELLNDPKKAVRDLSYALIRISKENKILSNIFAPLVSALEQEEDVRHLVQVILTLDQFDFSVNNFPISTFGAFFNKSLYRGASRAGKKGGERSTPEFINRLLAVLADPKDGETVYDPSVGQGSTLIEIHQLAKNLTFIGQERNPNTFALCKMNMLLNGIYDARIYQENSLLANCSEKEKLADVAVANFPFGLMLDTGEVKHQPYLSIPFEVTSTPQLNGNCLFVQLMLHQLNEQGRMFVVLPIKALYTGQQERRLREFLIRWDWLEAVISLPYGLLYSTDSPICVLAINKQKSQERQGQVLFINGANLQVETQSRMQRKLSDKHIECLSSAFKNCTSDCSEELNDSLEMVPLIHIMANDYNLDAKRYASPFIKEMKRLEAGQELVQLGDIFDNESPSVWFDADYAPHKHLPYMTVRDLGKSFADYKLELENLITTDKYRTVDGRLVTESVLMVNREGHDLLLSYFEYKGSPIVVSHEIMTFRLSQEKVHLEYLLLQLHSDLFLQQLNMYKSDREQPIISEKEFQELQIALPKKEVQEKDIRETKIRLLRAEELKVATLRHRLNLDKRRAQSDQQKIISSLQHELGNRLPAVLTEFKNLRDYLYDKIEDEETLSLEEPIYPVFEGEEIEETDKLGSVIDRIERILSFSISTIDATSSIIQADRNRLNLEYTDIKAFLYQIKQNYANEKLFSIQIEVAEDEQGNEIPIETYIDKTQMETAISNLIENAKRHGFVEEKKYLIRFKLGLSPDGRDVLIAYKNDGQPFPRSFSFYDFISYGTYAGENGHSGIGGYLIHQILGNHTGHLHYVTEIDRSDPFKVQFEISLPNQKKRKS